MSLPNSVSVIIPVYNGSRYLESTLGSVFGQTELPKEIIIIDDGSTDDSAIVIRRIAETNSTEIPIRVIAQKNQGQSAARNAGARVATGELLAFVDQDDRWDPAHLEVLAARFAGTPELGWAYCEFDEIDGDDHMVTRNFIATHNYSHPKTTINQLISQDAMILPSASIIRATAFAEAGGFDPELRGYEDDDLFIRIFRAGWRSSFVTRSLTYFRVHPHSSSGRGLFRESRMKFFEKVRAELPDDHRLNRYYVTDLLKPRLLMSTITEYSIALGQHRDDEAKAIADSIAVFLRVGHPSIRTRWGMRIIRKPGLTRWLLRMHRRIPRRIRPSIHPALGVRE